MFTLQPSPSCSVSASPVCPPSPETVQGVTCLRQGEPHSEKKRIPGSQSLPSLTLSLSPCMCVYRGTLLEPPAPHHPYMPPKALQTQNRKILIISLTFSFASSSFLVLTF